jgi:hypothetical protein
MVGTMEELIELRELINPSSMVGTEKFNIERDAFSKVKVILISHEQKVVIKCNDLFSEIHSLTQIDIHSKACEKVFNIYKSQNVQYIGTRGKVCI